MAADKDGRQMLMQEPGQPMVAALVKEFGVYPPGCFVRLALGKPADQPAARSGAANACSRSPVTRQICHSVITVAPIFS